MEEQWIGAYSTDNPAGSKFRSTFLLDIDADRPGYGLVRAPLGAASLLDLERGVPRTAVTEVTAEVRIDKYIHEWGERWLISVREPFQNPAKYTIPKTMDLSFKENDKGVLVGNYVLDNGFSNAMHIRRFPTGGALIAESPKTWKDFKELVLSTKDTYPNAIYRGLKSTKYRLRTTLSRKGYLNMYRYWDRIINRLVKQTDTEIGKKFDAHVYHDLIELLSLAQHHGFPTPLMDWTRSPFVAAFFAFYDAKPENEENDALVRIWRIDDSQSLERWDSKTVDPRDLRLVRPQPFCALVDVPTQGNPRAQAQEACALITNWISVDHLFQREPTFQIPAQYNIPGNLAIDIPVSCQQEAIEDLRSMGITKDSLFPNEDSFFGSQINHLFAPEA